MNCDALIPDEVTHLCQVVTTLDDPGHPSHLLLRTFGQKLVETSKLVSSKPKTVRIGILNQCWKSIMKMTDIDNYLRYIVILFSATSICNYSVRSALIVLWPFGVL